MLDLEISTASPPFGFPPDPVSHRGVLLSEGTESHLVLPLKDSLRPLSQVNRVGDSLLH